jgi:hypothetical protein
MSPVIAPQINGAGYFGYYNGTNNGSDYNSSYSGLSGGSFQSAANWITYPQTSADLNTYTSATGRALCVRS